MTKLGAFATVAGIIQAEATLFARVSGEGVDGLKGCRGSDWCVAS